MSYAVFNTPEFALNEQFPGASTMGNPFFHIVPTNIFSISIATKPLPISRLTNNILLRGEKRSYLVLICLEISFLSTFSNPESAKYKCILFFQLRIQSAIFIIDVVD
jgi:hypothetical protein